MSARRERRRAVRAEAKAQGQRVGLLWRWRRVLFMIGLVAVAAVAGLAYVFSQVPLPDKDPPQAQTSFICAADVTSGCNADNAMAQLRGSVDRVDVDYDQIPKVLIDAVVSAEDKNFFKHNGVDPTGVARAMWEDVTGSASEQGGSTITQQYVKTVYLTNERNIVRKIKEGVLAVKLERALPKTEILNRYLNAVYFGRGAYGVQAASKTYFGKDVGALNLGEAAYLAGLIRSPETADAALPPTDPDAKSGLATATFRRRSVLDNMLRQHYITKAEHDYAAAAPWTDVLPRAQVDNTSTVSHTELGTQYIVDYVRKTLVASGQFTDAQLYGGGLRIYTTIDYGLQNDALKAVTSTLRYKGEPSAALVSVDTSGRINAMLGGLDYGTSQVNLATGNLGGGGGRQAGSGFKPFAIAEALTQGMTLGRRYNAPPSLKIPQGDVGGEVWDVSNDDKAGYGNIDMVKATVDSVNTYFAQLSKDIGPQNLADMATRMGVASKLLPVQSLVLGTSNVSVLDMASGYSTLMDDGNHIQPYIVSRVTDASGQVLFQAPVTTTRVLTKNIADQINWTLTQVVQHGTGTAAQFGPTTTVGTEAGKTGTTEDFSNAWFTGYTCKLTASVWMGYPNSTKSMRAYGDSAFGGGFPAQIWNKFMAAATAGLQSCPYPRPPNTAGSVTGLGSGAPSSTFRGGPTSSTVTRGSTTTTGPSGPTTVAPTTVAPTIPPPTQPTIPPVTQPP